MYKIWKCEQKTANLPSWYSLFKLFSVQNNALWIIRGFDSIMQALQYDTSIICCLSHNRFVTQKEFWNHTHNEQRVCDLQNIICKLEMKKKNFRYQIYDNRGTWNTYHSWLTRAYFAEQMMNIFELCDLLTRIRPLCRFYTYVSKTIVRNFDLKLNLKDQILNLLKTNFTIHKLFRFYR